MAFAPGPSQAAQSAPARQDAEIIVLPARLRLAWIDAVALDLGLGHLAFHIAAVIGTHFNKNSGTGYPSKETIGQLAGADEKSVWRAIGELERSGYLLVRRRDLGTRATDGRRVAGGKGRANEYLPAFGGAQLSATDAGTKLNAFVTDRLSQRRAPTPSFTIPEEGVDALLLTGQRRACELREEGTHALPTLIEPIKIRNSGDEDREINSRASAQLREELLGRMAGDLRIRLSCNSRGASFSRNEDGTLIIEAARSDREWLISNLGDIRRQYGAEIVIQRKETP